MFLRNRLSKDMKLWKNIGSLHLSRLSNLHFQGVKQWSRKLIGICLLPLSNYQDSKGQVNSNSKSLGQDSKDNSRKCRNNNPHRSKRRFKHLIIISIRLSKLTCLTYLKILTSLQSQFSLKFKLLSRFSNNNSNHEL